jgi:hypothetical protein
VRAGDSLGADGTLHHHRGKHGERPDGFLLPVRACGLPGHPRGGRL